MLETAIRAAREAGRVLLEKYDRPLEVSVKGLRDICTEADLAAEQVTLRLIREGCPDAVFVSEESNSEYRQDQDIPTWYIDPLDGTTNYARALPIFSVSVAMARAGQVQCGAVYDPLLEQMFWAERGQGAYLNGARLSVSSRAKLMDSMVLLDWPRDPAARRESLGFLARLGPLVDSIRSRGSAALGFCSVAAGRIEAYFQYTLQPWDVAAGSLIVQEAGGITTDLKGQPGALYSPDWLVTNGLVHEAILAVGPWERSKALE